VAACPEDADLVVEIGPGRGALTGHLLRHAKRVVAIEVDPVLVQYLTAKFRGEARLEIVEGDVLKTDFARWRPAAIAGNLPYYITSPIIEKVLAVRPPVQRAVFLVQKEVAQRLAASSGTRDYGYLTVATQFLAEAELLFTVAPGSFRPRPKVESAVVRLTPRGVPLAGDAAGFLQFASACFRQKRKTLRNNLSGHYPREVLDALAEGGLRAEQLPLQELLGLYRRLAEGSTPAQG
jgi:16S rRNA (adenine1518-N6/adenine1519-N6)-dimethyltransferase